MIFYVNGNKNGGKFMKYLTSGNPTVDAMAEIHITGNITPSIWYKTILRENGKPYRLAIDILADIVYWYRPMEMRDERTGGIIGWKKKFKADLLQKSYRQYAEFFGESIRSVEAAMKYLQSLGVITRVPRNIQTEDGSINYNVTFLKLNVEVLYNLTYPSEDQVQNFVGGTAKFCTTNTENTTKNSINQSREQEERMIDVRAAYEEIIKENIEYEYLIKQYSFRKDEIDEIVTLMTDTVSYKCETLRIGKKDVPYQDVKSRFLKLTRGHMEYVLDALGENCTKIKDSYSYNMTTLFNAPATMSNHYRALVSYHNQI